jgi:aspartyl-tRNA synthetase
MLRTHTCGELTLGDQGKTVTLCGWLQRSRDMGGMTFIDLRDRYGITQLVFNLSADEALCRRARDLGREFVLRVTGEVTERSSKNPRLATGDIEITVRRLDVLNPSALPPFTIEDESDGGDDLRMKFRYLDIRRAPVLNNLLFRHRLAQSVREYLDGQGFVEIETPVLIKSTPEGARDFIVPSRMNPGQFYALPQSPQTFKQLLMVAGLDKYFQIVRCFRDEDLRADRQPEFTQIDCEMSFVERDDVLHAFEGLALHLFERLKGFNPGPLPRMTYDEALRLYGTDKPDLRFGMPIADLTPLARDAGFKVFDAAEAVLAIAAPGCGGYSRKDLDALTDFVKKPQIGASGLVYVKYQPGAPPKSSVDKFFDAGRLDAWKKAAGAGDGDLLLVLAGATAATRKAMSELRLEMGRRCGLLEEGRFAALWVVDFPLLERDEASNRFYAMHHPFTAPKPEDLPLLDTDPGAARANAYDLVINGVEIGGGSIRIHDRSLQQKMFGVLGFTPEEAGRQFGFLMNAFEYGAPPHGGIAFGFDRLCAVFNGQSSIRDFIAFPKNNAGRDAMIDAPSDVAPGQLDELGLSLQKVRD